MVVVRTQNFLSPAARGSGTRGSGTNAKFSKSSLLVVVVCVVVVRTQNFQSPAPRGKSAKESKAAMVLQHQATSAAALLHGQLMTT